MPNTFSDTSWAVPGVERTPTPDAGLATLAEAVRATAATDPSAVGGRAALARAQELLGLVETLRAAALAAVADVDARELWAHAAAGSTRTWLRTLPCGDAGQLAEARSLADAPLLRAAVADGSVAVRTAVALARQLARVPAHVEADQLDGVLVDGIGSLLAVWAGAACPEPDADQAATFAARQDAVRSAVEQGRAAACWGSPASALEAPLLLVAQVLSPSEALAGAAVLVDALQPEPDTAAEADAAHCSRELSLRRLKSGGWSLRAHLTDETGALLAAELDARDTPRTLGGDAPADTLPTDPTLPTSVVEGTPLPSRGQRAHDALAQLLADLDGVGPGSGAPAPAHLTIRCTLDALHGAPGALAGVLVTPAGRFPLTPGALRRHGCSGRLAAVLVDAADRPVGASGSHRHATRRERRAMRVAWGDDCAVNGCGRHGPVPHHAEPWWKTRRTRLPDLLPLCDHHHHDVHDGRRTLRLRDGRLIDEQGWVDPAWR